MEKCRDVALVLCRGSILKAYKEPEGIPWPLTPDDIELSVENTLPEDLIRFLSLLIAGKEENETSEKVMRLISSIGQDLCRAHPSLHDNQTLVPIQKKLTTILNKLGHSESQDFGLEMETALTKALDEVSTHLTPQIVKGEGNIVFHCEWDNLNKTTSSIHGSNIVNRVGGIMVQEVNSECENSDVRTLPVIDKSLQWSLKVDTPATLPPLTFNRAGSKFPEGCTFTIPADVEAVYATKVQEYCLRLFPGM